MLSRFGEFQINFKFKYIFIVDIEHMTETVGFECLSSSKFFHLYSENDILVLIMFDF